MTVLNLPPMLDWAAANRDREGLEANCRRQVVRGVLALDAAAPDWRSQIVLSTFDISSGCRCVVGQLCGLAGDHDDDMELVAESSIIQALELATGVNFVVRMYPHELGFDFDERIDVVYVDDMYVLLQGFWEQAINGTLEITE